MVLRSRVPLLLLTLVLCGLSSGAAIWHAGRVLGRQVPPATFALECVGFPTEGQRQSSSQIRLLSPNEGRVHVEVNFLDVDRAILNTRQFELRPGAEASFELPTWQIGIAVQILASAPVGAEVTMTYDGSVGPPERRTVPCWRAASP
jgi:hypothetical protein